MKTQVWVYIGVIVLSIGAGVAIAGLPDSSAEEPTIQPPVASESTVAATEPADTEPAATEPAATEPDESSTTSSEAPATTEPAPTSTTSETTTSEAATTTVPAPTTTAELPERADIALEVANGANVGGAATRVGDALEELGYGGVGSFDGELVVDRTAVFAIEGFQGPADRLAAEVGLEPGLVFPIETAPDVGGLPEATELLLYLGRDVESLPIYS